MGLGAMIERLWIQVVGGLRRLVLNAVCFHCRVSVCLFVSVGLSVTMTANGLALGEEADYEVLNCLPALNLIRSAKLQLSTELAFLPNACYVHTLLLHDETLSFRFIVCF